MNDDDKDLLMRRIAAYLAVLIVVGFFSIMVLLAMVSIPAPNKDTVIQMVGALILAFGGLMGYLYGSSKSGEAKDRAIAAVAMAPPVVVPPAIPPVVAPMKIDDTTPIRTEEVKP